MINIAAFLADLKAAAAANGLTISDSATVSFEAMTAGGVTCHHSIPLQTLLAPPLNPRTMKQDTSAELVAESLAAITSHLDSIKAGQMAVITKTAA